MLRAPIDTGVMIVGSRLMQEALAALLARQPGVETAGTTTLRDAVAAVRRLAPDVVLMELSPESTGAVRVLQSIAKLRPPPRVIVICNYCTRSQAAAAIDAGAAACISHDSGFEQIARALAAVRRGECYLGPRIAALIMTGGRAARGTKKAAEAATRLTARERQVLAHITQGETEREIAKQLGVSPKTVHTHRTSIMRKLGVHNVIALVRQAIQLGLVDF